MANVILLPPSEGKREGGSDPWDPGADALGKARRKVASHLRAYVRAATEAQVAKLFGVGGAHLDRAVATAKRGIVGAPTLPARERYTGVVWEHLDLASLPAAARRHADRHLLVVSGLAGFVAAGEPLPDYRLKMGARLDGLGALASWWKPRLQTIGADRFGGQTVVDLLTNEHGAAFDPRELAGTTVRVRFVAASGAQAAGHGAKAAKGRLARTLVAAYRDDPVAVCAQFADAGFAFADARRDGAVTNVTIRATPAQG